MAVSQIRFRRGTTIEWNAFNPVLALGEPGLDTTLNQVKMGDGVKTWTALPYQSYNIEALNAAVAAVAASATEADLYSDAALAAKNAIDAYHISTTFTWNPASLATGAGETSAAVTLTGVAFGQTVQAAAPYDLQGLVVTAYVSAANTVRVRIQNGTGATIDLASGTWTVRRIGV